MKIGIICYPTYGGSGMVATELGLALARKGHQVHFITYRRPPRLSGFHENISFHEVTDDDYPLFEYPPYDTTLASKLVEVVHFEQLDLLHVHYAIPHATVAYLAKKVLLQRGRYIPVITTLHGTDITVVGNNPSFAPVVEFSINKSDGVTAVSQSLRQQTFEYFHIQKDIQVIYNFVDLNRFRRTNKEHFKKAIAPQGERILIHVSNFRKVKRVEDVLHMFQIIHQQIPAKLLLVGDGPERRKLEDLCRRLKLCDDIRFLGKQDAIEEILAVADLFVMPSENESFGLAALEAMACQVPVISTNTGGLPEINIHGKTGFLSPIGDVQDMAHNALKLLANETLLDQFRKNALEQARKFDINRIVPQYEAYYQHILDTAVHTHNMPPADAW